MALTDIQIKGLKPADKPYRKFDGKGLYIQVSPSGGRLFRFKYHFNGKEKTLSIGQYPDISLSDARKRHQEARELLAKGIDPSAEKKTEKLKCTNSFEQVAREWWESQKGKWTVGHAESIMRRLEANAFPWLKDRPVDEINTGELLQALRRIESRNAIDTAKRIGNYFRNIFIYAVACGYSTHNPAADLTKALKVTPKRNLPAITEPSQITELLRAIDGFKGTFVVGCALRFAPLVFVRMGELRAAEWTEFDLDNKLWIIPAKRMKMKRDHVVPLARQAVAILKDLEPFTGSGRLVFPSVRTPARPMSENTLNVALRRLGYSKDEMVSHGFRSMASTRLHEMGWKSEIIEFQLAHADKNKIRAVYNRAEYLEDRIVMMQSWADYLDALRVGADIIPFKKVATLK
jgi:integrase